MIIGYTKFKTMDYIFIILGLGALISIVLLITGFISRTNEWFNIETGQPVTVIRKAVWEDINCLESISMVVFYEEKHYKSLPLDVFISKYKPYKEWKKVEK